MSGPQRLPGERVERLRHAVPLPLLHQRQRPAVRGEDAVAQRLTLFIQQEQTFSLGGYAHPGDLVCLQPTAFHHLRDHPGSLLPELRHIALGAAGFRYQHRQRLPGYRPFPALSVIQTGFNKGAAAVQS